MGDYELDEIQNAHEVTRAIGGRFWSEETLYFQARVEAIGRKLLADRNAGKADAEARIAELEAQLAAIRSELSALRPLSEAGTQGEWRAGDNIDADYVFVSPERVLLRANRCFDEYEHDARLIAAAVNAVRRMLAREGGADP